MAERNLSQILQTLKSRGTALPYAETSQLLSKAKLLLLQLNALTPTGGASPSSTTTTATGKQAPPPPTANLLLLARETYELGALASIRARKADAFTRYVRQLQPFYELPADVLPPNVPERNKVTGLYLLLLLTQGSYAEFHTMLESLASRDDGDDSESSAVEDDRFLGYPVRLERWLMEGSYDRVWKAMKSREVPSEEYAVFSEILITQIRNEIALSSERAYPSLPISSTKSLLFLESEGAVVSFAKERGWTLRDGHIYFPEEEDDEDDEEDDESSSSEESEPKGPTGGVGKTSGKAVRSNEKEVSRMIIQNALGYARELETIV